MSCPFCVNCQVFDSAFRFPLLLGLESHMLYYNTYSCSASEVRQYCWNDSSLKFSEKQYRDNRIELSNCAYWDIEIVTAIVKVIVHELHPSNIHVIVDSQDRNDWNNERPYPSNSLFSNPPLNSLLLSCDCLPFQYQVTPTLH